MLRRFAALASHFALAALAGGVPAASSRADEKAEAGPPLKVGIIGLDTSHVVAFTNIFNNPKAEGDLAGVRVVAGFPAGSDIAASRDRVAMFTERLRGMGIEIVDSIPALLERVDAVLLESVDGRVHLEQVRPVIAAGKPVFIDKPASGSLHEAFVIYHLAKKHGVPCFSSSSLRFAPGIAQLKANQQVGEVAGAATWGPCTVEPTTPDLYFYGIHGVEALYALMGPGCQSVSRIATRDTDLVTGVWKGDRVGTYRGIRKNSADFGAVVFGSKAIAVGGKETGYEPLCREIARFFKTGIPPVSGEETLEILAFMEAADESKRLGGAPVLLETIMTRGREAAKILEGEIVIGR
jgi:hypothetical protein